MTHQLVHRHLVREAIRKCTACPLHQVASSPVPFSGPSPCSVAVVGEAPGQVEDRRGEPFVGPAGQLIREMLRGAGMDPEALAWVNAVCCFPKGTPTKEHRAACRHHLLAQLSVIRPRYVLALGNSALQALHPAPPQISRARGLWFPLGGLGDQWAFATYHPASLLRGNAHRSEVERDVAYFSLMVREEMEPAVGSFCVKCDRLSDAVIEGFPYCGRCYPRKPKVEDVQLPLEGLV